jgi:outer membrane protein OmpA-like peptidoglycan-associated protein
VCAMCLLFLILGASARSAHAQLSDSPDPLAFGNTRVGNQPTRDVTLSNSGVLDITIDSCAIDAPAGDFSVTACPTTVPAGGSATATVQFAPQVRGADSATLRVSYALGTLSTTTTVTGRGVAPDMVVTVLPPPGGSPIDFGEALAGTASATTYTFRVDNQGDAALDVARSEAGMNPTDWAYAPPATTFTLAAGESRDIEATFTPGAGGTRGATVTFTDVDGLSTDPSRTFALTGTGRAPSLEVDVAALAFGSQSVGTQSAAQTATISNGGDADLTITNVTVPGPNGSQWQVSGFPGDTLLGPGDTLEIDVVFAPTQPGAQDALLRIASDSPVPPATVDVALNGSGVGASGITLSPTALTFGAIDVQTGGPRVRTLTIGNTGNLPLEIGDLYLEDLDGTSYDGDEYSLSTEAPLTIPPDGEVTVDITYQPTVESAGDYAVLVLETDSPEAPIVEVTLSGRGLDRHIAVSDPDVRFPDTYRNPIAPATLPLEITNTGESPLRLEAVMIDGDAFSLAGELPEEIPPLDSVTVELRFHPPAAGELTGAILLVNDDDQRPMLRVDLSGAGILPPITASLEAIDFGSATLDLEVETPGERFITLRNRSQVDTFMVQSAQVTGPDGQVLDGFDIYGLRRPVELEPGDELVLEVVFHPRRAGDFGGTLELLVDEDPLGVPLLTIEAEAVDASLRGGGCRAVAGRSGGGAAALALLLLAACLGSRRRRVAAAAAAVLGLLAGTPAASAQVEPERQTRNLDLSTFRPAHNIESSMLTVESTAVGEPGAFSFDVWIDYARNPLVVETAGGDMVDRPIADRATFEIAGSYAFGGRFEVSGALPILSQAGSDPQFSGIAAAEGSALGDIRLRGKAFLYARRPFAFGTSAEVTLPTGSDSEFAGGQGPSAALRLLSDYSIGAIDVAANAGALMRQKAQLADVEQGHQFLYGLAGAYRFTPEIAAIGELFGAIDIGGGPAGGKPLEAVLGGRYRLTRAWTVVGGVGRGLLPGIGSPDVRVFAAVAFAPRARPVGATAQERFASVDAEVGTATVGPDPDADGDGVPDHLDRCPERAEDRDQHEDADGCPDADNDRDNIADGKDGCPGEPEDADGFADEDGCPDPDNDRDGVFDAQDQCPVKAEVINGNADDDGCPDKGEPLVFVTKDRLELFEPIRFKGDSAELTRASIKVLGQVGATLRANPDISKLHIRVHLDKRGKDDDPLSVRRAETVRTWLVEWGIAPERLEGVGFGSRFPLGKGRALNDRVELEITRKPTR